MWNFQIMAVSERLGGRWHVGVKIADHMRQRWFPSVISHGLWQIEAHAPRWHFIMLILMNLSLTASGWRRVSGR